MIPYVQTIVRFLPRTLAAAVLLFGSPVLAQSVDVALFQPTPAPSGVLTLRTARPLPHFGVYGGAMLHYANDELTYRSANGELRVLGHRAVANLGLGLSLFERVDLSATLPVVMYQSAMNFPTSRVAEDNSGVGDLWLSARGVIVKNRCATSFGLAAAVDVSLPTAGTGPLMGEGSATVTPRLAADFCFDNGAIIALNAGFRVRQNTSVGLFVIGDEVRMGLGGEVPLGAEGVTAVAELNTAIGLGTPDQGATVSWEQRIPLELLAGLRYRHAATGLGLTVGMGSGLTEGYGSPDFRLFVGLGFGSPTAEKKPVSVAVVSEQPKPVPEGDDPPLPPETVELTDSQFDRAVAADPDPDADGLIAASDKCPQKPEDFDNFEDDDGCPDPDNDLDGSADADDACPLKAEVINGIKDEDGCPDEGKAAVRIAGGTLQLDAKVYFETGSAEIKEESHGLLRQAASTLKAAWYIKKVLVEGHTDSRGDKEMNVDLSERRARSVALFLTNLGVDAGRLTTRGYGPKKPVASNRSRKGRAKNRRVVFRILERVEAGKAVPAAPAKKPAPTTDGKGGGR